MCPVCLHMRTCMRIHVRNTGMRYMLQLCLHMRTGTQYPYCIQVCDTGILYRYAYVKAFLQSKACDIADPIKLADSLTTTVTPPVNMVHTTVSDVPTVGGSSTISDGVHMSGSQIAGIVVGVTIGVAVAVALVAVLICRIHGKSFLC